MKKTKRSLALLLAAGMVLSMTACGGGSAKVKPLESKQVEADVQEYFTSYVDADSQIVSVYQSQNEISETEKEISCQVKYTTPEGDGTGEVVLQYIYSESTWTLNGCSVDLADVIATVAAAVEGAEEEQETSDAVIETKVLETPEVLEESSKAPVQESNGTVLAGFKLTEAGSFENPGAENLNTRYSLLYRLIDDDTIEIYGPKGSVGTVNGYDNYTDIDDDSYAYAIVSEDTNNVQLMNGEGELLLDEPALAITKNDDFNTLRFLKVYYSTEVCSESDEYLVDMRDSDNNHTYHKGYIKVFDLEKECFVPGIEISDNQTEISANYELIVVRKGDTRTIYNENGEVILETTASMELSKTMAIFNVDGCTYVYDSNGERFTSAKRLYRIDNKSDYLNYYENSMYYICDENGNDILPGTKFDYVSTCRDGIFKVQHDDEYQLITLDGTVMLSSTESLFYLQDGWWYDGEDDHLISSAGIERSAEKNNSYYNFLLSDGNKTYTILNTGDTFTLSSDADVVTPGIISTRGVSGKLSLYDLFTGEKLLDQEFATVYYSRGYIYGLDGKSWHSYKVEKIFQ